MTKTSSEVASRFIYDMHHEAPAVIFAGFGWLVSNEFVDEFGELEWRTGDLTSIANVYAVTVIDMKSDKRYPELARGVDVEMAAQAFLAFERTMSAGQKNTIGVELFKELPEQLQNAIEVAGLMTLARVADEANNAIDSDDADPLLTLVLLAHSRQLDARPRRTREEILAI